MIECEREREIRPMRRRQFIIFLLCAAGLFPALGAAHAEDGGSSGSGSDGSSGDNGGGDSGGGDDGGGDGGGGDGGNSGSGSANSGRSSEQDRAKADVEEGKALPLEEALKALGAHIPGRVIDVSLKSESQRLVYRFKVKSDDGSVRSVVMDAKTGKFRNIFGF
jgi:Peptidase propeptide and YPEB domain